MSDDPQLLIVTPRRGRPRGAPTACISTRMPADVADELARVATHHRLPVAALLREVVICCLADRVGIFRTE